jgi:hypothetical protein
MRTPRIVILAAFVFTAFTLTYLSFRSSRSDDTILTRSTISPKSGLRSFFSLDAPLSLFPPNALISLTDDNTTFFQARPAAFGPGLPVRGLSGQLWVGSGFGDDVLRQGAGIAGAEGELGCSDVPGWSDGSIKSTNNGGRRKPTTKAVAHATKDRHSKKTDPLGKDPAPEKDLLPDEIPVHAVPHDDGTDDYLYRPSPGSAATQANKGAQSAHSASQGVDSNHADIQSIQEGAEIEGKVVLLSRGGCGFLEKVKWVQRRGGIALIVGDDTKGGPLIQMYARGDTSNVTIPAIFTSWSTAHLLSHLIPQGSYIEDIIDENGQAALKVHQSNKPKSSGKQGKKQSKPVFTATTSGKVTATPNAKSAKKPTSTPSEKLTPVHVDEPGWFSSWFKSKGSSETKSSSANSDWVLVADWDENEDITTNKNNKVSQAKKPGKPKSQPTVVQDDNFVIGVQDWRDPDLVDAPGTRLPEAKVIKKNEASKDKKDDATAAHAEHEDSLNRKSITPGSGEYREGLPSKSDLKAKHAVAQPGPDAQPGLLTRIFGDDDDESEAMELYGEYIVELEGGEEFDAEGDGREGLWVTLTPASGASPFFDTLLVLVVSPLVTLTVVYALLILRSRIRRRRWRAPKSVVERLPVRTYQTIPPSATHSRLPSPTSSSPSTPLLQQPTAIRPRPRSRTTSGLPEPGLLSRANSDLLQPPSRVPSRNHEHEKSVPGASEWKKYMSKQVECVVCLEEYIDGVSRVMSLPCGHEFHVDCM